MIDLLSFMAGMEGLIVSLLFILVLRKPEVCIVKPSFPLEDQPRTFIPASRLDLQQCPHCGKAFGEVV